jgi:FkbM family methyltransferase
MSYSQNNEEEIIGNYFMPKFPVFTDEEREEIRRLTVLDIGANDGVTLSNSRRFIEGGAIGVLVEPSPRAYERLEILYAGTDNYVFKAAIAKEDRSGTMFESDSLLSDSDIGLVSSALPEETRKWKNNKFTPHPCEFITFRTLQEICPIKNFDLITIDAEGMDYEILSQIDLEKVQCSMVIVEHNGKDIEKYFSYCAAFGMRELSRNAENLIMAL